MIKFGPEPVSNCGGAARRFGPDVGGGGYSL
jgi:hypothetical protein